MLETLFGNKTIQKILIFLLVNGKCYGTQLSRLHKTPLTPLQKALARLEKGGVLQSIYEGKTRMYQFNPTFPLLGELEILLKKAYALLSPLEKNLYMQNSAEIVPPNEQEKILLNFWERLSQVQELTFHAKTKSQDKIGWKGKGEVAITKKEEDILIFNEKGSWKTQNDQEISFSNAFRWTLDRRAGKIALEHLRRGLGHPVFLFHLAPTDNHTLISMDSHFCEEDTYFGKIFYDEHSLRLNWRVIGPKKNEELDYFYT